MKKLGIAAALAALVTVGGVYATWSYAESVATEVTDTASINITLADTDTKTGTIKIHDTLVLTIDNEGNYTPGWDDYITDAIGGALALEFEANSGSNTVTLQYTITISGNTYTDDKLGAIKIFDIATDTIATGTFTYDPDNLVADPANGITVNTTNESSITKTWTYSQFIAMLPVNQGTPENPLRIDTYEEYGYYSTALQGVEISIKVEEI